MIRDQWAGPDGNMTEDELAAPDRNMTEDELAGPDQNKIEDELAGPDGNMTKDELAGPDLNAIKDEREGPDQDEDVTNAWEEGRGLDQDEYDPRHNIQAWRRRSPNVIVVDTWANQPQRSRSPIIKYQAGTRTTSKRGQG